MTIKYIVNISKKALFISACDTWGCWTAKLSPVVFQKLHFDQNPGKENTFF